MSDRPSTTTPSREPTEAQARSQVYAYLSRGFLYPDRDTISYLRGQASQAAWCLGALGVAPCPVSLEGFFTLPEDLEAAYIAAFGHTIAEDCPPYEAEYGNADIFQKSQALADISGFYQAFGVEPRILDRPDHLSVELEFMHFLTLKEAYALDRGHGAEPVALCREAQASFLKDHLGRWVTGFSRRLQEKTGATFYGSLGELTGAFVAWDLARLAPCPLLVVTGETFPPPTPEPASLPPLPWAAEAEARLSHISPFVRAMARRAIDDYARHHGFTQVTPEVMTQARNKMGM